MWGALIYLLLYVGIIILPVVVSSFVIPGFDPLVAELGKCMALAGFMILALQFFLAARYKWMERPFGLDILIRYHQRMAVFGAALLLAHPLLLAAGGGGWRLLIGLDVPWVIWLGKATLTLLILSVLISLYQKRLRLKFEKWRLVHDILGPVILASAFTHSWFVGDDLESISMKVLWTLVLVVTAYVFIHHKVLRPRKLREKPYRVLDVRPETENVWTVKLAPPEGASVYPYFPGQFHFITFLRGRGLPVEEHHWTISSSPTQGGFVTSTIKGLGDFTSTMGETRTGDKAVVHGAFGRFSYTLHPHERDLVFIAGGIGITPLMSMLRHMRDSRDGRSVLLLYGNPSLDRIVFREELAEIEKGPHPALRVVHVLSRPGEGWTGETGHVDRKKIEKFCGSDLKRKVFYVCGPPPLLKSVINGLRDLGVDDGRIRMEIFSFLD